MKRLIPVLTLAALTLSAAAHARTYTVKMMTTPDAAHPYRFSPAKLHINPGDTVTFVDAQDDRHDVMFESMPKGAEFAMSPMLRRKGQSWSYTFKKEGTYQYHCHPHEALGMRGVVIVGKASQPHEMHKNEQHHHDGMPGMDHQGMTGMGHDMGGMDQAGGPHHMDHMAMRGAYGNYPMTREASGTSWVPQSSPMQGIHAMSGDWMAMIHGDVNFIYDHQGGKRGDEETFSTSMLMVMASRGLAGGTLGLRSMLSLDPAMGKQGYPLLLQTGETANGADPLIDRQHPHDMLMELAASYSHPVGGQSSAFVYAGYPGEPALGPATFMHRPSGEDIPEAPITHHWLDSTHIDFGVVTVGYIWRDWKVEASVFNGREPDQYRWNFDPLRLNSYSGRISYNPTDNWSLQVSRGHIRSPEQLEPDVDQNRTTASAIYNISRGDNNWATTLAWGLNQDNPGHSLNATLLESAYTLHDTHTFFGRAEYVAKDELFEAPDPLTGQIFHVGKLSLGYIYDIPLAEHLKIGFGGLGSVYAMPSKLDPAYGDNPASAMAFIRLKLK